MARSAVPTDAGVPEILPRETIGPDPYQRIQAPAEAFGSGIAQGMERLGQGGLEASSFFGQVAAQDAANQWETESNKILYGDPNVPGDRGFYGKQGRDALDAMPATIERLSQLREQTKSGLTTPDMQQRFDERTFRINHYYNQQIGSVYDREFKQFTTATNKATADLALSSIGANPDDDTLFNAKRDELRRANIQDAQNRYGLQLAPDIAQDALGRADRDAIATRIRSFENTDPARALSLFDQNRALLAGSKEYVGLEQQLRSRASKSLGDSIFQSALGMGSGDSGTTGGMSVGGAIPRRITEVAAAQNVDPTLALTTAQIESSMGRNLGSRGNIFQLGSNEWASVGGGRMGEPDTDIRNGVAFLGQKKQELASALGREPQPWEIYLAHQQGTGGAVSLLNHPNEPAGKMVPPANISGNGGDPNAPASAFTGLWRDKYSQTAGNIGAPAGPGVPAPVAVGDSIAAHLIRFAGAEGKEDRTAVRSYRPGDTAVAGYTPGEILNTVIPAIPAEQIQGKPVLLSTGASNGPAQINLIPQQIAALKERGAASVTLLGVGTAPSLGGVNDRLAQIAQESGAAFAGPLQKVAADGIHSSDNADLLRQARGAMPAAGGNNTAAPDQIVGQAPPLGQTPPVSPAPGMADLANAESELARRHAQAVLAIENDPRSAANPEAMGHAIQKADINFRARQMALTAQKQALTETRAAAADQYVQRMMKGPIDPTIVQQIADDSHLDSTTRENLWRLYDAHTQKSVGGDTAKYGPKFFDYYQRITAADDDPNKIRDPSQILSLAVPKPDGSQDLTLAGVDKLRQELTASRSPERVGDQKRVEGAMAYAKHQLSFEQDYGYFKIPDPKGADAFNVGFIPSFFSYYEKGLAAGKRPDELLSQDAIDKLIAPLKRSPEDLARDRLSAGTEAGTASAATKPPAPGAPPAAAINYLHAHPELRGAFEQKYKVPAAQFLTPLDTGPQVPMAR